MTGPRTPRAGLLVLACLIALGAMLGAAGEAFAADPKYRNDIREARRFLLRGAADEALGVYEAILSEHPGDEQAVVGQPGSALAETTVVEVPAVGKAGRPEAMGPLRPFAELIQ